MFHEVGETSRKFLDITGKVADRVVQASLSSPYYSFAGIALLSAMMVRGKLISPDTSNLVTGTGLVLLGANAVTESIPLLSGMSSGAFIDNEYDKQPVSPWAIPDNRIELDESLERYLETVES